MTPAFRRLLRATASSVLIVCIPAIAGLSPAIAHDVPRWKPLPAAGMKITYKHSDGTATTHTIEKVDGDDVWNVVRFVENGDRLTNHNITFRSVLTWYLHRKGEGVLRWDFDRARLASLWPLKVGNSVHFRARLLLGKAKTKEAAEAALNPMQTVDYSFTVEGRRHVTTKAGTYQAWIILRIGETRDLKGKLVNVLIRRFWIAEDLGWIVRLDSHSIRPEPGRSNRATLQAEAVALPAGKGTKKK